MKTYKFILFQLVILISLTFVMPFNIISADTSYVMGVEVADDPTDYIYVQDTGPGVAYVTNNTESVYFVGYRRTYSASSYICNVGAFSYNPFTLVKTYNNNLNDVSGTDNASIVSINSHNFYMSRYGMEDRYISTSFNSNWPLFDAGSYNFSTSGMAFEFLKITNNISYFDPISRINANEIYRVRSGANDYIHCTSDAYVSIVKMPSTGDVYIYVLTDDPDAQAYYNNGSDISMSKGASLVNGHSITTFYISRSFYENDTYYLSLNKMTGLYGNLDIPLLLFYDEVYDVPPPVNYGDLKINFYTKYAGSGGSDDLTWRENEDVVQWSLLDTNGFNIADYGLIELRAVPGSYVASSYASLINQGINDFILENFSELTQRTYILNPYDQEYKRKWGNIVDNYLTDIPLFNLYAYSANNSWYKNGWVWQARIVDFEDPSVPITEWQTIYNSTSYSGDDSLNNPSLNPDAYDTFQEINNVNNITNNYWYINNAPVGVDNNIPTSDGTWIEKLIESIANLIGTIVESVTKIIDAILGIGSDIIKGLFDLITTVGVNIIDTFTDLWNRLIELIGNINFTDENPEFDLNPETGESVLDIIPAFIRMINSSGLGYMIWIPFVVGIVFMII